MNKAQKMHDAKVREAERRLMEGDFGQMACEDFEAWREQELERALAVGIGLPRRMLGWGRAQIAAVGGEARVHAFIEVRDAGHFAPGCAGTPDVGDVTGCVRRWQIALVDPMTLPSSVVCVGCIRIVMAGGL